jgi:two-component system chemotaxis response regulator CheY
MPLDAKLPILVVDDYQTMVKIVRAMLAQLGFEDVDSASDGQEALSKMRDKKYGLVISDWNMEPMNGLDLLRKVRAEQQREVRFIMVTAESKTDHVIAARRAGVDNYIVKPFNAQTLQSKIQAAMAA